MKRFILCVALLLGLCVKSPAPTVNFASPPFSPDFIVNQPGNSIAIRFPGVTNVAYIPGTFGYISNQIVYLGTNNFAGGGGGGGGITTLVYTNGASIIVGSTLFTKTNYYASTSNGGGVTFVTSAGANGLNLAATVSATITGDVSASGSVTSLAATVTKINGQPLASLATGLLKNTTVTGVPVIAVVGVDYGTLTNVVYTNAGPDTLTIGPITYLNTNTFGGGGGGSGITQLTGDVVAGPGSGSQASTVKGLNGTILSGLQSGVMLNTFGTGAPSTVNDWVSLAGQLSLLIPQSALGTGSGGTGTKFLADDQTYKTPAGGGTGITNLVSTNSQSPSVTGGLGFVPTGFISNSFFNVQSVQHAFAFGGFMYTNWSFPNGVGASTVAAAVAADFNGDGLLDFATPRNGSSVAVFTNAGYASGFNMSKAGGAASNITPVGTPTCIVVGDVNGDGKPDIIIQSASAVQVFTNSGIPSFVQLGTNYTISGGTGVYAQDYNGDGSIDFISSSSSTAAAEYTNNGSGIFVTNSAAVFPSFAKTAFLGATAHFMGTARWDLALGIPGPNVLLLTNNGAGIFFAISTNVGVIAANGDLGVGDFNNDGKPDLMDNVSSNNRFYVYTNNGAGVLGIYATLIVSTSGANLPPAAADFNLDGWQDILVPNSTTGYSIYTNTMPLLASFQGFVTNLPTYSAIVPSVGDFNNDGRPDIEWGGDPVPFVSFFDAVDWNLPIYFGVLQGDGNGIQDGNISVIYSSSIVTPANAWTPGSTTFGNLTINTNYPPLNAIQKDLTTANGNDLTNVWHVTTSASTSGTVTADNTHQVETTYLSSGSTIGSITIALPTTTIAGRAFYIHSKSAVTTLAVTGGSFIDAAVTAMSAGQTLGYQTTDTAGTYLRLQ